MSSSTRFWRSLIEEVAEDGGVHGETGSLVFQQARLDIELLGGDAQRLRELLQDLRARLAQPALDLAEIGVGDAGLGG